MRAQSSKFKVLLAHIKNCLTAQFQNDCPRTSSDNVRPGVRAHYNCIAARNSDPGTCGAAAQCAATADPRLRKPGTPHTCRRCVRSHHSSRITHSRAACTRVVVCSADCRPDMRYSYSADCRPNMRGASWQLRRAACERRADNQ